MYKVIYIYVSVASDIFWFPFIRNVFFHPFILSLYMPLNLEWISCSSIYIDTSCFFFFLICSTTLCFFIGEFNSFSFKVIIDRWGFPNGVLLISYACFVVLLFSCSSLAVFLFELMIFHSSILWFPSFFSLCVYYMFLLCGFFKA